MQSTFQIGFILVSRDMIHINKHKESAAEKHPFHFTVCLQEWMGLCEQFCATHAG